MYVLGIETATPVAGVGVVSEEKMLAERFVNNRWVHSVKLLPMIRDALLDAEIKPEMLGGIAISTGPGSFTGLRIGMACAKTLAQVWGLPVVGVSTLEALALSLTGHNNLICPVLNARKGEVYAAVFDSTFEEPVCLQGPVAVSVGRLFEILSGFDRPVIFLGDGVSVYGEELRRLFGSRATFVPRVSVYPRGAAIAELGLKRFLAGQGQDPLTLRPEYFRLSEAEVALLRKNAEISGSQT